MMDDDFDELRPEELPDMGYLRDLHRPHPHPGGPFLQPYDYLGVSYYLDADDVAAAERALMTHLDACYEIEIDGCAPANPFCGCSECHNRATAGFWISYTIDAIRRGTASIDQPPPPEVPDDPRQLTLGLDEQ